MNTRSKPKLWILIGATSCALLHGHLFAQVSGADTATGKDSPVSDEPLELRPLDAKTAVEVGGLIPQLAALEYDVREEAARRLIGIGAAALPKLHDAYLQSDDLEVRLRIEQIVYQAYMNHHVFSQKGFLGISLRTYRPTGENNPPIPEGTPAVALVKVIPDTGADRAGLQVNDVVIALNGEPLDAAQPEGSRSPQQRFDPIVDSFSRRIAAYRPGDRLMLSLYRGQESLNVEVTLGVWSEELRSQGRVTAINEALEIAHNRFDTWWYRHFHR